MGPTSGSSQSGTPRQPGTWAIPERLGAWGGHRRGVGWEGRMVHSFQLVFLGGCLPVLQHHVLLSPQTATGADVAPVAHLYQHLLLPHFCVFLGCFPFPLVSAAPHPRSGCSWRACVCVRARTCRVYVIPPSQSENTSNKSLFQLKTRKKHLPR